MNFALLLFVLLLVCSLVWVLDRLFFQHMRGTDQPEPWWIEYPKSFLPVILAVFVLRSFLV
ncbi:MAG: signal peptidase I, partial [Betaproteobacteria bacterium]|nr:signal peptidase I [Betaproteobacteria bacterium]